MEKLIINSNDGFLHLSDLPYNCIFNKVVTGCGGTTIVLNNNENYVVAVPTTELIINKCGSVEAGLSPTKNIFGLFGKFTDKVKEELKEYTKKEGVKKIMCTYDKLPKLVEYINTSEYRILVDEYHSLLKAYSYRENAIDGVLNSFRAYKSFCFMSATPINAEFKPTLLESIPEIVAQWSQTDTLLVKLEQTNKPFIKAANIINSYKKDGCIEVNNIKSYEAFFFINSVTDIKAILDHCKLTNDEVRIICADNDKNKSKLTGYTISNSTDKNKMFNFITSKSFEGVDYYSETGMCFVVSSPSNVHTLASIDTDIPQIAGRIRTKSNPFRNLIVHIYNTTTNNLGLDITYEEKLIRTNRELELAQKKVDLFNSSDKELRTELRSNLKTVMNNMYMSYSSLEDRFTVNDILPKLELYNYRLNQVIYSSGLAITKAYEEGGALTTDINWETITENMNKNITNKLSFKDVFIRYAELKSSLILTAETDHIIAIQPLVVPAFHKLGVDKVRSLKYIKKDVEAALIALDTDKNVDSKIATILRQNIKTGFISNKDAKQFIQAAYNKLGVTNTAKATDLIKWFDCEATSKRIDIKKTNGYNVYRCRSVFKS